MRPSRTIAELLTALRPESSPSLIWYGPDSERIELSGRVLDNWVAKTANLLAEEFDAGPGTVVRLEMAPHWRSMVWALATWQAGATLNVRSLAEDAGDGSAGPADVVVSSLPERLSGRGGAHLAAVALGALQLRWDGELPEGALDYAAEVRSYADYYLDPVTVSPQETALEHDGGAVTFAALLQREASQHEAPQHGGHRNLLVPADTAWSTVLAEALATWLSGGTVVLVHPAVELTQRLLESERISERL